LYVFTYVSAGLYLWVNRLFIQYYQYVCTVYEDAVIGLTAHKLFLMGVSYDLHCSDLLPLFLRNVTEGLNGLPVYINPLTLNNL
jgi:hypothetical protein